MAKEKFMRSKPFCNVGSFDDSGRDAKNLVSAICRTLSARGFSASEKTGASPASYETVNRMYSHNIFKGYADYAKQIVNGAALLDGGVLIVSSLGEIGTQVTKQAKLFRQIGVSKVVVFIDNVDKVNDLKLLGPAETEIRDFLSKYDFDGASTPVVCGSSIKAIEGDKTFQNKIVELAEACDNFIPTPVANADKPFLLPIEEVITIKGRGTVVTGRVERGTIHINEKVERVGLGEPAEYVVTGIEMFRKSLDDAQAGENIGMLLRGAEKKDILCGMVLAAPNSVTAHDEFMAEIYILTRVEGGRTTPIPNGFRSQFYFRVSDLTGEIQLPSGIKELNPGDIANVSVKLIAPIALEKDLRFTIREGGKVIGCGIVTKLTKEIDASKPHFTIDTIGVTSQDRKTVANAIATTLDKNGFAVVDSLTGNSVPTIEYNTDKCYYTHIIDNSGQRVNNILVGRLGTDASILVINANDGVTGQTREQMLLAQQTALSKLVVFVDKCDKVTNPKKIDSVMADIRTNLESYGFASKDIAIVCGSASKAIEGDKSYQDKIMELMDACDACLLRQPDNFDDPFYMTVKDVLPISGIGNVIVGDIESGVIHLNDKVQCSGSGTSAEYVVTRISFCGKTVDEAKSGDTVGLVLRGATNIVPGMVLSAPNKAFKNKKPVPTNNSKTTVRSTADIIKDYNAVLGKISTTRPIILLPVRLETSFRHKVKNGKNQKQLRVRIIPDEIMLNYNRNAKFTPEEVENGKFFWIQWFIASGCKKREKEAWDTLCSKYPVYKAAWICDALRPSNFEAIREGKNYFYRRPYSNHGNENIEESGLEYIEKKCQEIYGILSDIKGDIDSFIKGNNAKHNGTDETQFEFFIRTGLGKVNAFIYDIEFLLQPCEYIVDYLYDNVHETFVYLQNQLQSIDSVYSKNPKLKNPRTMELWDTDYSVLTSLKQKVSQFMDSLEERYIRLPDMVKKYQNRITFPRVNVGDDNSPIIPVCTCLPEKFILYAEVANKNKDVIIAESEKVGDIQMAFDPSKGIDNLDDNGELEMPANMKWLTDYDTAEKNGMAITVDINENINEFRYIYVFGVQPNIDASTLRDLFYGHNYVNSNMRIVSAGTPTNLVNQEYVDEEDYIKDTRYKLEVEDYKEFPKIFGTLDEISAQRKDLKQDVEKFSQLCKEKISSKKDLKSINTVLNKIKKSEKENYAAEFEEFEEAVSNATSDKTIKAKLAELKENYTIQFQKLFNVSDYDARKIAYLLKGAGNNTCYNDDLLDCWARVIGYDSRQDYYTKEAYTTIWNYFEEHFQWGDNVWGFTDPNRKVPDVDSKRKFLKDFFINHVRARGNIAAIRIDDMPYGILPISDFVQMSKFFKKRTVDKNMRTLLNLLIKLANLWHKTRNNKAKWSEVIAGKKVQKKYLEMTGQTPYSLLDNCSGRVFVDSPFNPSNIKINKSNTDRSKNVDVEQLTIVKYLGDKYFKAIPIADVFTSVNNNVFEENRKIKGEVYKKLLEIKFPGLRESDLSQSEKAALDKDAEIYVSEFLDLFTHRIDAWFLGIIDYWFHKKIRTVDAGYVGAFGWIFNLKEDVKKTPITNRASVINQMELKGLKDSDQILTAPKEAHYVMAPSVQHALSAAVLRSSYFKSKSKNKVVDSQICVNLSSTRVRQALRLVEGVKSGMSLSIVLGTDFERYMHEAYNVYGVEMDEYIYPLRELFPQLTKIEAEDDRANDYVMQVVNGEALLNSLINEWAWNGPVYTWLIDNHSKIPWLQNICELIRKEYKNDEEANKRFKCLFNIIEQLMDSYDALNDLLLSEGVHRLIMGDKSSYYAISSFLAKGEGNLPDMQILNIPSEHVVVSHKAGVLLPHVIETADKIMCQAEPALNAWIEDQLGGMENILFFVQKGEEPSSEIIPCSLAELNVSGIEYMYLSAFNKTFQVYLETRFRELKSDYTDKITILESAVDAGYECTGDQISLEDDKIRLESIRNLVARGRAMNTADWFSQKCDDEPESNLIDIDDLKNRLSISTANLEYIKKDAENWLKTTKFDTVFKNPVAAATNAVAISDALVVKGYKCLCDCFESGLINCLDKYDTSAFIGSVTQTSNPLEYDKICIAQKELALNVYNAYNDLCERVTCAQNALKSNASVEGYISALQAVTLSNFKVCYKFKTQILENDFDEPLEKGVGYYFEDNFGVTQQSFDQWQDEMSEVREGMRMMHQLHMAQLALDRDLDKVSILQVSIPDGANCSKATTTYKRWLGAEVKNESELRDADSLVLYNSSAYTPSNRNSLSGFVFDSWIEYIPYKKHDAGFAFHNDWPDNEAPQSMLVAWHPKLPVLQNRNDGFWDMNTLVKIIRTTRFMMMNRAVEPDHIYGDNILSKIFPLTPKTEYKFSNEK